MQPEGPRDGECRLANQLAPPEEEGIWRPRPSRVRMRRQRLRQVVKNWEISVSWAASEEGIGCWAWLFVNSPKLNALVGRLVGLLEWFGRGRTL